FDHFGDNPQVYGQTVAIGLAEDCENEVVGQLVELQRHAAAYVAGRPEAGEEFFFAEQNARLARDAEEYYRAMFRGRVSSWNLRDTHMAETLDALVEHLSARGRPAKIV